VGSCAFDNLKRGPCFVAPFELLSARGDFIRLRILRRPWFVRLSNLQGGGGGFVPFELWRGVVVSSAPSNFGAPGFMRLQLL